MANIRRMLLSGDSGLPGLVPGLCGNTLRGVSMKWDASFRIQ